MVGFALFKCFYSWIEKYSAKPRSSDCTVLSRTKNSLNNQMLTASFLSGIFLFTLYIFESNQWTVYSSSLLFKDLFSLTIWGRTSGHDIHISGSNIYIDVQDLSTLNQFSTISGFLRYENGTSRYNAKQTYSHKQ